MLLILEFVLKTPGIYKRFTSTFKGNIIKPGTPEHGTTEHGTPDSGGTTEHYSEHQGNTPKQRNHTKRRTIVVFLRGNLKLKSKLPAQG